MQQNKKIFSKLIISGQDNYKFLQGQFTANLDDLENLDNTTLILSAYCNIKGQVISVFYINKISDNYILYFLGDTAEIFLTKIKKYSIFSKVTFSPIIYSTDTQDSRELLTLINPAEPLEARESRDWDSSLIDFLISHKIPIITQNTSEHFFPENINLVILNAVSFKKGCFLGQEVIARMHYKGKSKRKLYTFELTESTDLYNHSGSNLTLADNTPTKTGEVVFVNNSLGYAVIEDRFIDNKLTLENLLCSISIKLI